MDLFLRLAEFGKLANLDEVLLEYRQHLSSIAYRSSSRQYESAWRAVGDACLRRGIDLPRKPEHSKETNPLAAVHRKWAWWALGAGNLRTARKHALRAIAHQPASLDNWRLCACVLRGH
jgi:hypothetical protein